MAAEAEAAREARAKVSTRRTTSDDPGVASMTQRQKSGAKTEKTEFQAPAEGWVIQK